MKSKLTGLLTAAALMLMLTLPTAATALPTSPSPMANPTASAPPNVPTPEPAEPHPQIRAALAALRNAKAHLEHAAHDFGGHRVDAIKAVDEAIRQLELALKYDKD